MPQEPLSVTSYSDLLQPIPNATEALKAHNAELMEQARNAPARMERVQWYRDDERRHHHHHHHHHHHGYYGPAPEYYAPPVYYAPPPPPNAVIMQPGIGVQLYGD